MYVIIQNFFFLALAVLIGGAIGYKLRDCFKDTACDDVRDDLARANQRYENLLAQRVPDQVAPMPTIDVVPLARLSDLSPRALEATILDAGRAISPVKRLGVDDLTIIKGITPKLDAWLAKQNITRFEHLISLTPAELYWLVENAPENGSSIYADQWIAQARAQMR